MISRCQLLFYSSVSQWLVMRQLPRVQQDAIEDCLPVGQEQKNRMGDIKILEVAHAGNLKTGQINDPYW
jgi:hypothetical protein